jgi:drug/metabolite transporter (DMT)-like permease
MEGGLMSAPHSTTNSSGLTDSKRRSAGLLVALGASLWALDSVFRRKLVGRYSAFLVVAVSQLICSVIVLPLCWQQRRRILGMPRADKLCFLYLALAGNLLAMVAFTAAFSMASNFTVPILIQKVQPFVTVLSAVLFLKEKLPRGFFYFLLLALLGSFLLSWEGLHLPGPGGRDFQAVLLAFFAAFLWGSGTAVGRFLSLRHSFWLVTAGRYGISTLAILCLAPFWGPEFHAGFFQIRSDLPIFFGMALVPGLFALFVYYRGMQATRASVACILELAYPVSAVFINWVFLGKSLSGMQILGSLCLIVSAGLVSYREATETA